MTREEFCKDIGEWSTHRPFLWAALEATKHLKLPVLEMGCGDGSTPFLQQYCIDNQLELNSFDSNKEWADKFDATWNPEWNFSMIPPLQYSVALVDEAPGEHRQVTLGAMRMNHSWLPRPMIIIAHDTQPSADHGYQMRDILKKFRYMIDFEHPQAWATMVSEEIDVRIMKRVHLHDFNYPSIERPS